MTESIKNFVSVYGLSCSNCDYATRYNRLDNSAFGNRVFFFCRRHPQQIQKEVTDWCGDHSKLEINRLNRKEAEYA